MQVRRVVIAAIIAASVAGCRTNPAEPTATEWDSWPWMTSDIPAALRLSARLVPDSTAPGRYLAMLTFTNPSNDALEADYGACSFGVRLYADSLRAQPLWDDRPPPNSACILPLYIVRVAAGKSSETRAEVFDPAAATRALGVGRYYAAVVYRSSASGHVEAVPAGMISLP